eukprot:5308660-Pyramimonas_sp.AAC.1
MTHVSEGGFAGPVVDAVECYRRPQELHLPQAVVFVVVVNLVLAGGTVNLVLHRPRPAPRRAQNPQWS